MNSLNIHQKDNRLYKVKNPSSEFLCALCNTKRQMRYSKSLTKNNYYQILVLSSFLIWLCWNLMGFKALSLFFITWTSFEVVKKALYRKEIPCPHCGFDATWYRRNVNVARNKVESYWDNSSAKGETKMTLESLEKEQQEK